MLQFTQKQIDAFRKKSDAPAIARLLQKSLDEVKRHFLIPPNKAATWSGFYACPDHSSRLVFDISSPNAHRCSTHGEIVTGKVYNGAWWRIVNDKNQQACYHAALLYLLQQKSQHLAFAKQYLLEYAKVYPGYEIHGGIPYNNPGKANAQTLCDAGWIKGLVLAYDILQSQFEPEEQQRIEQDLFLCCGEFLMEYRSNQIHNHEVVVDSAIAMIGLLLQDKNMIDFGLYKPYGIHHQLKEGLLQDKLWFEGTPGYHFYTLEQIMLFETMAGNTSHSFFKEERFTKALAFPLHMLMPDGTLPLLNDTGFGYKGFSGTENIYELAYAKTRSPEILKLLRCVYQEEKRLNIFSFFFGVSKLPDCPLPKSQEYHAGLPGSSGLTSMLGSNGRYLLVKHSPFGGEHDHYDRLGIHFMGFGKAVLPDIGTSLYGAPLHYQYYKNTPTHNTVSLDGENQPPANCQVHRYEKTAGHTLLDTSVCWDGSYVPMNTLVISQWSDKAYQGAVFRRVIAWYEDFFIDCFLVNCPKNHTIDYTLHIRANRIVSPATTAIHTPWATKGASHFLSHSEKIETKSSFETIWDAGDGVHFSVFTLPEKTTQCYYLTGPDNPASSDLSYFVQRTQAKCAFYLNVISVYQQSAPVISSVSLLPCGSDEISAQVIKADGKKIHFTYCFKE